MLNKLTKYYLNFVICVTKRSVITKSNFDLAKQMKILNDEKKFGQALHLFNKYEKENIEKICNQSITQALKSCTYTNNLERGVSIEKTYSSRAKYDSFLLTSMVHLYSKFIQKKIHFIFIFK